MRPSMSGRTTTCCDGGTDEPRFYDATRVTITCRHSPFDFGGAKGATLTMISPFVNSSLSLLSSPDLKCSA